mgnify:CR=1 FL=1
MKKLIFLFALLTTHPCFTQKSSLEWSKNKKGRIVRSGSFFGVQTGKFWVGEIGVERQSKQLKIKKPNTQALFFALNYDIDNAVIGSDIGCLLYTSDAADE